MRNLINFLLRHSSWIVLAIYVAISCVLLFGRNPYQRSIYLSSANQVASAVYDLQSEVTSYFGLREVNRNLQLRNGELEMEVINLKEQLNRYRSSVGKDTIPFDSVLHDYDFAVARVVNNSVAQINNYITIDKGRAEGIEPCIIHESFHGKINLFYSALSNGVILPFMNKIVFLFVSFSYTA